jgi:hypothetical protein
MGADQVSNPVRTRGYRFSTRGEVIKDGESRTNFVVLVYNWSYQCEFMTIKIFLLNTCMCKYA